MAVRANLADGFWVATFHTGLPQRVTAPLGIWRKIKDRLDQLERVTWLQEGLNITLHYEFPIMSINGVTQPWPRRWDIVDKEPICQVTLANTPSESPSPVRLYTQLGLSVSGPGYRARMRYRIFPDGTYRWRVIKDVDDETAGYEGDIDGWKLYYEDASIITSHMMAWEDAPNTGIVACLIFFPEGHPSYPRAVITDMQYVWKLGNTIGYACCDEDYTRGHVKTFGSSPVLTEREYAWMKLITGSDFSW